MPKSPADWFIHLLGDDDDVTFFKLLFFGVPVTLITRGHWHFYKPFQGCFYFSWHCSSFIAVCVFVVVTLNIFGVIDLFTFNWLFFFLFSLSIMGLQVGCLFDFFYIWRSFKITLLRRECLASQMGTFFSFLATGIFSNSNLPRPPAWPGTFCFLGKHSGIHETSKLTQPRRISLPSSVNYDVK